MTATAPASVDTSWRQHAASRGIDPELFFPAAGAGEGAEAKAVCARCPVAEQCLDFALMGNERYGIWGGTSERDRRRLRAARRLARMRAAA